MEANVNQALCKSIMYLAQNASEQQLKKLNSQERVLVVKIANAIIVDKDLPNVETRLLDRIINTLGKGTSKEAEEKSFLEFQENMQGQYDDKILPVGDLERKVTIGVIGEYINNQAKRISNSIKHFFGFRPSSIEIQTKIDELNQFLSKSEEKLLESHDSVKEAQNYISLSNERISSTSEAFSICKNIHRLYLKLYNDTRKEYDKIPSHYGAKRTDFLSTRRKEIVHELNKKIEELTEEIEKIRNFDVESLQEDLANLKETQEKIESGVIEGDYIKVLDDQVKHFSERMKAEKNKMNNDIDAEEDKISKNVEILNKQLTEEEQLIKITTPLDSVVISAIDDLKKAIKEERMKENSPELEELQSKLNFLNKMVADADIKQYDFLFQEPNE